MTRWERGKSALRFHTHTRFFTHFTIDKHPIFRRTLSESHTLMNKVTLTDIHSCTKRWYHQCWSTVQSLWPRASLVTHYWNSSANRFWHYTLTLWLLTWGPGCNSATARLKDYNFPRTMKCWNKSKEFHKSESVQPQTVTISSEVLLHFTSKKLILSFCTLTQIKPNNFCRNLSLPRWQNLTL